MVNDVKFIEGILYYEGPDGKYYQIDRSALGGSGGGSGGGGGKGIIVEDDGTRVGGNIKVLNFTGAGVTVTAPSSKQVDIDIPGYVIESLTTAQRLALSPTTALIVEDTDLDMYFKWSTVSSSWSPF